MNSRSLLKMTTIVTVSSRCEMKQTSSNGEFPVQVQRPGLPARRAAQHTHLFQRYLYPRSLAFLLGVHCTNSISNYFLQGISRESSIRIAEFAIILSTASQ